MAKSKRHTETSAVKAVVKRYRGKPKDLRLPTTGVRGREKKLTGYPGNGTSVNLGNCVLGLIVADWYGGDTYPWGVKGRKRLGRRVAKKMRQPFRRKDRGPLRQRAEGKRETRPNRSARRM